MEKSSGFFNYRVEPFYGSVLAAGRIREFKGERKLSERIH